MSKVEYRFLQFVLSHVTGDRVSVALLHWDGTTLRVASSLEPLVLCEASQREAMKTSAKAFIRRAEKVARDFEKEKPLDSGLDDLFRVREGLGGALFWSSVVTVDTRNAEAHFEQLRKTARLTGAKTRRSRRISANALSKQLVAMGTELQAAAPRRVKVNNTVKNKQAYQSPLSWKNGRWHHVLPFSVHGLDEESIQEEVRQLVGLAQLALPKNDVPIVVALIPEDAKVASTARKEAKTVCSTLSSRDCEVIPAKLRGRDVELEKVRRRIERDLD